MTVSEIARPRPEIDLRAFVIIRELGGVRVCVRPLANGAVSSLYLRHKSANNREPVSNRASGRKPRVLAVTIS